MLDWTLHCLGCERKDNHLSGMSCVLMLPDQILQLFNLLLGGGQLIPQLGISA